ncbi:MAG: PorT family protein [Bacteroidales bacterium]|nr:PorT family protein [Bacteroidales bacterium]
MKKIFPLIGFLLLVQLAIAQVNFGARMGANIGTFEFSNSNTTESYEITFTPNVLINLDVDVPFSTVFSFRTGLGFVVKGAEFDAIPTMQQQFPDSIYSALFRMNYLEIPLFLVARAETDFFGTFFLGGGPTLSLGVGGRMEMYSRPRVGSGQGHADYLLVWGNRRPAPEAVQSYNHFRRFDMGLGAFFSYQFPRRGITFTVSYNRGLRNLSPNPGMDLKTTYIGFSLGFMMGGV